VSPTQPNLFPTDEPSPSAPEGPIRIASVVFNRRLDRTFHYRVPAEQIDHIGVGKRVEAPLGRGNRLAVGYCIDVKEAVPDRPLKSIHRVLDDAPLLTPALLELSQWMAGYYLCGWGQVLDAIVPAGAKAKAGMRKRLFVEAIPEAEAPGPRAVLTPKQAAALAVLQAAGGPLELHELAAEAKCTPAVLRNLARKGYVRFAQQRVEAAGLDDRLAAIGEQADQVEGAAARPAIALNEDQQRALASIEEALADGGFKPFLLHGVTGSGKTEVYLRAMQRTVDQGKEAIVLVPEISLTPQTIARFRNWFSQVAVLHSHLTDVDRGGYWRRIAAGEVQVVVGARSAIFAPTRRLGLIVVDEEHESTFKQETTPRYHARDLAVMRAKLEGIPIVLGSATPSLESWHNAREGRYCLLDLPRRVLDLPLPPVQVIDMRHEPLPPRRYRAIGPSLQRAMQSALDAGGQVILLLNRRGFDTQILCPACGHVTMCKFCDVALTYHRHKEKALCHYCGYETDPPERCPGCGLAQVRHVGRGTEKLEAEIEQKFPGVAARRMDADTMRKPGSLTETLTAFRQGSIRILFGTQMIAKGLDFPNVTLVGVVSADTAMYLPDFRAAERTFQLIAQVAGRAGRGPQGGRVLVQTYNPEHPCVALAARHDYARFAEVELRQRQGHAYPPFARMARVILRGPQDEQVKQAAERLSERFHRVLQHLAKRQDAAEVTILGPAEAPLHRLRGHYRWHFQLLSSSSKELHDALRLALSDLKLRKEVELAVDVDPLAML
jgi:primosomal protein N' (replication factor Y)